MLQSSLAWAEAQYIEKFHDQDHAFVVGPDGAFVPVRELGLVPPFEIVGRENGQYLFEGPEGQHYRVYVPEVVTSDSRELTVSCDRSSAVFANDYRIASARGVGGGCEQ